MIRINIWDDYYEDGYVPDGEVQETYAYVESPDLEKDEEKRCLGYVMSYIVNNYLVPDTVEMELVFYDARVRYPTLGTLPTNLLTRWDLRFAGLTHAARMQLIAELQWKDLAYNGEPIKIYSES